MSECFILNWRYILESSLPISFLVSFLA